MSRSLAKNADELLAGGEGQLARSLGAAAADGSHVVRVAGERWRVFKVGEAACTSGCDDVAEAIHQTIGGEVRTVHADGLALGGIRDIGGGAFRNPAGRGDAWFYHKVVVKNGRVYDALTGPNGQLVDAYKSRWQYADAITFGF